MYYWVLFLNQSLYKYLNLKKQTFPLLMPLLQKEKFNLFYKPKRQATKLGVSFTHIKAPHLQGFAFFLLKVTDFAQWEIHYSFDTLSIQ